MNRARRGSAAMTALLVGACLAPMDPSKAEVELVHVTFGAARRTVDTIAVRATTRANAVAYAAEGHDVGITRFEFSSSDARVAVVDSLGTVRGISPGTAVITARAPSGKEGSATIVIIPATIAYRITLGGPPETLAFSVDATRLYVPVRPDSLAVIDALGQLRVATVSLGAGANRAAATTTHVIAFEAGSSSAALLSVATERASGALALGAPSHDIVALGERAYVAQGVAGRIAIIEGNAVVGHIEVTGEPMHLAVSRREPRLAAAVRSGSSWRAVILAIPSGSPLASITLAGEPAALALSGDGSRLFVLDAARRRVDVFAAPSYALVGSIATGETPGDLDVRQTGTPLVVVSGEPLVMFDGLTLQEVDRIPEVGRGLVSIRPDGLFVYVTEPGSNVVRVVALAP